MCCNSSQQKSTCLHQVSYINNPAFWSKKKKITLLEEYLEYLDKQITETKEALGEFKK